LSLFTVWIFEIALEKQEHPRQLGLHRGRSETLNLDPKVQAQVTSAREA
jgi:hypothetical protein